MMEPIKVKKLRQGAHLPTYGTEFSAGAEFFDLDGFHHFSPLPLPCQSSQRTMVPDSRDLGTSMSR